MEVSIGGDKFPVMITYEEYKNVLKVSRYLGKRPPWKYGKIQEELELLWADTTVTYAFYPNDPFKVCHLICHHRNDYSYVLFEIYDDGTLCFGKSLQNFLIWRNVDPEFIRNVVKERIPNNDIEIINSQFFDYEEFGGITGHRMPPGPYTTEQYSPPPPHRKKKTPSDGS